MTEEIFRFRVGNMANFTYVIADLQTHLVSYSRPVMGPPRNFQLLANETCEGKAHYKYSFTF